MLHICLIIACKCQREVWHLNHQQPPSARAFSAADGSSKQTSVIPAVYQISASTLIDALVFANASVIKGDYVITGAASDSAMRLQERISKEKPMCVITGWNLLLLV